MILATFVDINIITEDKNFCSIQNKKEVSRNMGIKDPNTLNNYIKKFKDKGVVTKDKYNYKLNKLLNPNTTKIEINISR